MIAILPIDPATLSSAQQKVMNFHQRRIITNPRVARAMKRVMVYANQITDKARKVSDSFGISPPALSISVTFLFAYPKSLTKRERQEAYEGKPVVSAKYGDLDNRCKAFIDALVNSRWFPDDRFISDMHLRKMYTLIRPCIVVELKRDMGGALPINAERIASGELEVA